MEEKTEDQRAGFCLLSLRWSLAMLSLGSRSGAQRLITRSSEDCAILQMPSPSLLS